MSAYFVSFDYQLFVKPGTTASAAPTSSSGMTEVLSLTNASINGTTDTTDAPVTIPPSSAGRTLSPPTLAGACRRP